MSLGSARKPRYNTTDVASEVSAVSITDSSMIHQSFPALADIFRPNTQAEAFFSGGFPLTCTLATAVGLQIHN